MKIVTLLFVLVGFLFDCANLSAAQTQRNPFEFKKMEEALGDIDVSDQLEKINAARISYVAALVAKKNEKIVKEKRKAFLSKLRAGKGKYQPDLVLRTFIDSAQKNYRWTLKLLLEQEEIREILVQRFSPELIEANDIEAICSLVHISDKQVVVTSESKAQEEKEKSKSLLESLPNVLRSGIVSIFSRLINNPDAPVILSSELKAQEEKKESRSLLESLPDVLREEVISFLDVRSTGKTLLGSRRLCQDVGRAKQKATHLDLSELKITDAILKEYIKEYRDLKSINLAWCYKITDEGVQALGTGCPGLKTIGLAGCKKITDAGIQALAKMCPGLEFINLAWCQEITDAGLQALAAGCKELENINLFGCKRVTNRGVCALAKDCKKLKYVNFERCLKIDNEGIRALAAGCPGLVSVDLSWCDKVGDEGLQALAKGCKRLKFIDLCNSAITDVGLLALAVGCKELEGVSFQNCMEISDKGIRAVLKKCSHLKELNLVDFFTDCEYMNISAKYCRNYESAEDIARLREQLNEVVDENCRAFDFDDLIIV